MEPVKLDANHDLIGICYRNFMQSKSETQLNELLLESIESLLNNNNFTLFSFNSFEETLTPITAKCKSLEDLGLGIFAEEIKKDLLNNRDSIFTSRKMILVAFKRGLRSVGCVIVKNRAPDDIIQFLNQLGQIWVPCRDRIELEHNNARLASDLARSLHNFSVVRDIADSVSKAMDLRHLLVMILKVAISTVSATRGFIMLENENSGELELKVVHGLHNEEAEKKINAGILKGASIPVGEGVQGRVMESREPVILTELEGEGELISDSDEKTNSLMCVPLVMNDQAFGVIYVTNQDASDPFDQEDLDVLSILATHASSILDQARLYDLATTDELTGLHTRRFYTQRIGEEFKRCIRYKRQLSLLVIDIDFFKRCNDDYGHAAGDQVLKNVAKLIKMVIRNDVDFAVRFGGEEFLMILPETDLKGASVVGERIRSAVENETIYYEEQEIKITLSVGGACFPDNTDNSEDLFKLADSSLYKSKSNGRNQVTMSPVK